MKGRNALVWFEFNIPELKDVDMDDEYVQPAEVCNFMEHVAGIIRARHWRSGPWGVRNALAWIAFNSPGLEDIYIDDEYTEHPEVEDMTEDVIALAGQYKLSVDSFGTEYYDDRPPSHLWESY